MLNRRILRIKAFKVLYSYSISGGGSLEQALNELDDACQATRDLYLFMLALVVLLTKEAYNRIEAGKAKFNPTESELHPNEKFAENKLATILDQDIDFQKLLKKKNLNWEQYDILIRSIYDSIQTKPYYKAYMANEQRSLKDDCDLFIHIFEEELVDNKGLEDILEEKSILWIDDLAYALTYCCHTFRDIAKGRPWALPDLYISDAINRKNGNSAMESDSGFVRKLLTNAYAGYQKYFNMITILVPDWDSDRLFYTDIALIILGLAEAENFSNIDVKITINEYVEISKYYGSPKSSSFINGLLHKLITENFNR